MDDELAERFESHRAMLRAVAIRMLGSIADADDAVQDTWLRLRRTDIDRIDNLEAWLRTVVARICLDQLRTRTTRREEPLAPEQLRADADPERDAVMIDSVGRALLVVLDTLTPNERVAFVLHDLFAVPFDQIAPIVDRSTVATKKLASRARQRVRGTTTVPPTELDQQRRVVEAFLTAARDGDLTALLDVLAPDVVRRVDAVALPAGVAAVLRGAQDVAEGTVVFGGPARFAQAALVDGVVGAVVAPRGRLLVVLAITIEGDLITGYDVVADPERLRRLEIAVLPEL